MEGGRYLGGGGPARSAQFEESMVVVSAQVVAAQEDGMGIGSDSHAPSWFWLPAYPRSAFLRLPALNDSDSMCSGGLMPDKEKKVPTYTIRLCKNGTEFKALSNVRRHNRRKRKKMGGSIARFKCQDFLVSARVFLHSTDRLCKCARRVPA